MKEGKIIISYLLATSLVGKVFVSSGFQSREYMTGRKAEGPFWWEKSTLAKANTRNIMNEK